MAKQKITVIRSKLKKEIGISLRKSLPDFYGFIMKFSKNIKDKDVEPLLKAVGEELKIEKDVTRKGLLRMLVAWLLNERMKFDDAIKEGLRVGKNGKLPNRLRAFAYGMVASVYARRYRIPEAERCSKAAMGLSRETEDEIFALILNTIGLVQFLKHRFALALEYFENCRKVSEKIGNMTLTIKSYSNAALCLSVLNITDKTIEYYEKSIGLCEKLGDRLSLANTLIPFGSFLCEQGENEKSQEKMNLAHGIFKEMNVEARFQEIFMVSAYNYIALKKPDRILEYASKALEMAEKSGQDALFPQCNMALGVGYALENDSRAEEYFRKCISLYERHFPDSDPLGIEFAYLEYGKFLLDSDESEAARLIWKAANILKKRGKAKRILMALDEAKDIILNTLKENHFLYDDRVIRPGQSADKSSKILEISKAITAETEMQKVLELVVDTALEVSGAERGFIVLAENGERSFAFLRNFFGDISKEPDYGIINDIIGKVLENEDVIMEGNINDSDEFLRTIPGRPENIKAVFAFPLLIKQNVIGCVYIDSRFAVVRLSQELKDLLITLMEQVAIIIDKMKLFEEIRRLSRKLEQKVEKQGVELEKTRLDLEKKQELLESRYQYKNIIGKSAKMQELFLLIDKITDSDLPVCIYGASGTGKELVAKAIHYNGPRKKKHFTAINCASIPESLMESELFGYEKGAFTGATEMRKGLFEIADGGTLFLDEIGNMSPSMQQKMLRVIQEKEIRRIGGRNPIKIDIRIISASNRDLYDLVGEEKFREDLYYRLNVLSLTLPTLMERKEDIPLLVEHFRGQATGPDRETDAGENAELLRILMNYDWPGNVRELENEINRLVSLGKDKLSTRYLSPRIIKSDKVKDPENDIFAANADLTLPEMERQSIVNALRNAGGNRSEACRILGIPRSSIDGKMKKFKIVLKDIQYD